MEIVISTLLPNLDAGHPALQRYRHLIDDWAALTAAMARPLPGCVWAHPLRIEAAQLSAVLQEEGLEPAPVGWYPGAFRLASERNVGHRWWYLAGLAHSQEEASLAPVALLAPQPGERLLDLCASPGGKSAQMAIALANSGTIIANDISGDRMRPLRANIERLGLLNISTTRYDGANFPGQEGAFDSILVDAPCSCDGTLRKGKTLVVATEERLQRYARTQRALLRRALTLCKPGGRVVYSTCSLAPEENEAVIDALLPEFGSAIELGSAALAGLATRPGVTRWGTASYSEALSLCQRLWPQDNNTGGFFLALIHKRAPLARPSGRTTTASRSSEVSAALPPAKAPAPTVAPLGATTTASAATDEVTAKQQALLWDLIHQRFALPEGTLERWRIVRYNNKGAFMVAADHRVPHHPAPEAPGIIAFKTQLSPPKLSTAGALLMAPYATQNLVELEPHQLLPYFQRESLTLAPPQLHRCGESGYVIVCYRGFALGTARLDSVGRRLHSLFPKRWSGWVHEG